MRDPPSYSDPFVAAAAVADRVIGHYPEYVQVPDAIGAKYFNIAPDAWNAMSPASRWAANLQCLNQCIAEGAEFVLATPKADLRAGSALAQEVNYLLNSGYKWAQNNTGIIPQ